MTPKMILAIVVAILSVLIASTAQLSELFGPAVAKTIVTIASLVNSLLASIAAVLSSQASIVKEASQVPGVEPMKINANASPSVAAVAIDPQNLKIDAAPGAEAAVREIARGNG